MTSEGKLLDAAEDAHRRAGAKVAALLGGPAIGQDRAGQVEPLRARSELERELGEARVKLAAAEESGRMQAEAIGVLQGVLREVMAGRNPRDRRVQAWRERLGALWPEEAGR